MAIPTQELSNASRFHFPPDNKNPDEIWRFLKDGLNQVMNHIDRGLDCQSYMTLYTTVYDFCVAQKSSSNSEFTSDTSAGNGNGGAKLFGKELYENLKLFLNVHLASIKDRALQYTGQDLLRLYHEEWTKYTMAAKINNNIYHYLNRNWIKREWEEGEKMVYSINTLHLVRWKAIVFKVTNVNVMDAALQLVEKQRNGEIIEERIIADIALSFKMLGGLEDGSSKANFEVYKDHFEKPFINATTQYYKDESERFLRENSRIEYMKKAEIRLNEEDERCKKYLFPEQSSAPLKLACQKSLIADHAEILQDEFQLLLNADNKTEELRRLYGLLSRIKGGLEPLYKIFQDHVLQSGLTVVQRNVTDPNDAQKYFETLFAAQQHARESVTSAFEGESEFVRALDNACKDFINKNSISPSGTTRTSELLAKYADSILKKKKVDTKVTATGQNAQDNNDYSDEALMEKEMDNLLVVFKYVDDKDVFLKFYTNSFAKRLVHEQSKNDACESTMISKLKDSCGFEFTNKLQRMINDKSVSKDYVTEYRNWVESKPPPGEGKVAIKDANFKILTTSIWPLKEQKNGFIPAKLLQQTCDRFLRFYQGKTSGRTLAWLWNLGKGELKANYARVLKTKDTPVTLLVSAYQMTVLLLFNDNDEIMYEDIETRTNLSVENLEPMLASFLKAKILLTEPEGGKPAVGTKFKLNLGLKSKTHKLGLTIVTKSDARMEQKEALSGIDENRVAYIHSILVQIMKSRKKYSSRELIEDAIRETSKRFRADLKDIKMGIDKMVERDYIERLEDGNLGYLA